VATGGFGDGVSRQHVMRVAATCDGCRGEMCGCGVKQGDEEGCIVLVVLRLSLQHKRAGERQSSREIMPWCGMIESVTLDGTVHGYLSMTVQCRIWSCDVDVMWVGGLLRLRQEECTPFGCCRGPCRRS